MFCSSVKASVQGRLPKYHLENEFVGGLLQSGYSKKNILFLISYCISDTFRSVMIQFAAPHG